MDVVDRYLKAVHGALPAAGREDILRELSEDIRSEMDDKASEVGRPLTDAEQEALLKQRGNPLLLAARYRQDHRTLSFGGQIIGPALFPFYVKVLSFNLGLTFAIITVIFFALGASGQKIGFQAILSTCLMQLFIQLGIVTLIFWLLDKHLRKHPESWDLSAMASGVRVDLEATKHIDVRIPLGTPAISRFESVSIIVASAVALAWITEVQRYPFLILGPAAAFLKLAPIWYQMYFPIVLLTVAEIIRASINLVRPEWARFRQVYSLILHAAGLLLVYFLIRGGPWVLAFGPGVEQSANYLRTVQLINQCVKYGLVGGGSPFGNHPSCEGRAPDPNSTRPSGVNAGRGGQARGLRKERTCCVSFSLC